MIMYMLLQYYKICADHFWGPIRFFIAVLTTDTQLFFFFVCVVYPTHEKVTKALNSLPTVIQFVVSVHYTLMIGKIIDSPHLVHTLDTTVA